MGVYDNSILLIVPSQGTGIEVGAAHGTELAIHHDDLGVVETWCIHPDMASCLHQFVGIVETTIWRQWNVTLGG